MIQTKPQTVYYILYNTKEKGTSKKFDEGKKMLDDKTYSDRFNSRYCMYLENLEHKSIADKYSRFT